MPILSETYICHQLYIPIFRRGGGAKYPGGGGKVWYVVRVGMIEL